jgi:hypothetical protein
MLRTDETSGESGFTAEDNGTEKPPGGAESRVTRAEFRARKRRRITTTTGYSGGIAPSSGESPAF